MRNERRTVLGAGVLALVTGFTWAARADEESEKAPKTDLVQAEVRVDANTRPDFSGTWTLNEDLSEDPHKKMQEAGGGHSRGGGGYGGRGGMGGGGGRGGMGGGGRHRGNGDSGERGGGGDGALHLSEILAAQRLLTISHKDPQVVIRDLNGRSRTFFTDARKVEEERAEGTAKIQTKWKDRSIVVVTKLGEREITDTYERAADGARLFLTTTMEGGRAPISFRRVYESALTPLPAEDGAAEPKSEPKPPST